MKRVIVTGANGFIGRAVVDRLTDSAYEVSPWTEPQSSLTLHSEAADAVVHLVASARHGDVTPDNDGDVAATEAVLDYCRVRQAVCVFASTAGVYRAATARQDEGAPIGPENAYAARKLAAEERCREATARFGIPCTILRLFNVYGPGQRRPFLVPYVVESLAAGEPLELRMPEAVRDFVFVDDVARAFVAAVDSCGQGFRVINIGSGQGTGVADLVAIVARLLGKVPKWDVVPARFPEVLSSVADIQRARDQLGWAPLVALEAGLMATCEHAEETPARR